LGRRQRELKYGAPRFVANALAQADADRRAVRFRRLACRGVASALPLPGAPAHLHLPLLLALWTGQRQGDLLRLPWSGYDGKYIRLRQRKTGAYVEIPVGAPLKAALDKAAKDKRSPIILTNLDGQPWKGFGSYFAKVCKRLGIVGVTFNDLRGSVAGCTEAMIATITAHSLRDVNAIIMDKHYLHRDRALAEMSIHKLEAAQEKNKPA
jgi:integrase